VSGAPDARPARLEWLAAGVSALVVLGLVAALAREALGPADAPPALRVTLEPPRLEGGTAHLRFRVENAGGRAATAVSVALDPGGGHAPLRVVVDYVAPGSAATGGFMLRADAAMAGAAARIEGYVDP
jgi:uncharacterized protein (TIGR02588 family)